MTRDTVSIINSPVERILYLFRRPGNDLLIA
jgi:hypothetical protein